MCCAPHSMYFFVIFTFRPSQIYQKYYLNEVTDKLYKAWLFTNPSCFHIRVYLVFLLCLEWKGTVVSSKRQKLHYTLTQSEGFCFLFLVILLLLDRFVVFVRKFWGYFKSKSDSKANTKNKHISLPLIEQKPHRWIKT